MRLILEMNTLDDRPMVTVNTISVSFYLLGEAADTLMTSWGIRHDPTFKPPRLRLVDITQFHVILLICADRDSSIVFIPQVLLFKLHLFRVIREVNVFEESVFLD